MTLTDTQGLETEEGREEVRQWPRELEGEQEQGLQWQEKEEEAEPEEQEEQEDADAGQGEQEAPERREGEEQEQRTEEEERGVEEREEERQEEPEQAEKRKREEEDREERRQERQKKRWDAVREQHRQKEEKRLKRVQEARKKEEEEKRMREQEQAEERAEEEGEETEEEEEIHQEKEEKTGKRGRQQEDEEGERGKRMREDEEEEEEEDEQEEQERAEKRERQGEEEDSSKKQSKKEKKKAEKRRQKRQEEEQRKKKREDVGSWDEDRILWNMLQEEQDKVDAEEDGQFLVTRDLKGKEVQDDGGYEEEKAAEWKAWGDNEVYEWVEDVGQPRQRSRWVLTEKPELTREEVIRKLKGEKVRVHTVKRKARLCAQGTRAQDKDCDQLVRNAPTASRAAIRLLVSKASREQWPIQSFDVSTAFLQSDPLPEEPSEEEKERYGLDQRQLHLQPPVGWRTEGKLLRLKKVVYGYGDAPRRWYYSIRQELEEHGWQACSMDQAAFRWTEGKETGTTLLHVDDGLVTGTKKGRERAMDSLKRFRLRKSQDEDTSFTGVDMLKDSDGTWNLSQTSYADLPEEVWIEPDRRSNNKDDALDPQEQHELRRLVQSMAWCSTLTRPELACAVTQLQCGLHEAKVEDAVKANALVRRLRREKTRGLAYPPLQGPLKMLTFTDAGGKTKDEEGLHTSALSGSMTVLVETDCKKPRLHVVQYYSHRIRRAVWSSFGGETHAASQAADDSYFLKNLAMEITGEDFGNFLVTDCMDLRNHLRCATNKSTVKSLRIYMRGMKEMFKYQELRGPLWMQGGINPADSMTRPTARILDDALKEGRLDLTSLEG